MSARFWRQHGLTLRSDDVELDGVIASATPRPDAVVELVESGDVPALDERPPGEVLAELVEDGRLVRYVVRRPGDDGNPVVDVHFNGLATATLDEGFRRVRLRFARGRDERLASVLINGTVMSVLLMMKGHPVLHASSVVCDTTSGARALALVGNSGAGKSTLATALCRAGARLLGDDVFRVDHTDSSWTAWRGSVETRLRPGARGLAEEVTSSTTADGRTAARLRVSDDEQVDLAGLLFPVLTTESGSGPALTGLAPMAALLGLVAAPRVAGWKEPASSGAALRTWGALVSAVPCYELRVPWTPALGEGWGSELLDLCLPIATGGTA